VAPATAARLAELLEREVRQVEAFVELLRREQQLLGENAVDALQALVADKSRAAADLGDLAQGRDRLLADLGLAAGRAGMEAWVGSANGVRSQAAWHRLLALAADARSLNETNGRLIDIHLNNNQQALAVLMAAANQAATYGPDGQQKPGGGGRSLGSA
jgi:flagella synthesis protein FlgN